MTFVEHVQVTLVEQDQASRSAAYYQAIHMSSYMWMPRHDLQMATKSKLHISYDVASGNEITPCIKTDKPQVVKRFSGNVLKSITTLRK